MNRVLSVPNGNILDLGCGNGNILNFFLKYSNSGDYKIYDKKEITYLINKNSFQIDKFKMINHRTFALNALKIN
ncbi:hypothetical protein [Clostridium sp. SM-530-WT-3G]|uniref:hypothetical protein n=1 Tax=Clostridium sp. SM-530-WT-3G TaxID=2725303 RepID=UPI001FABFA95|nr:hypothetical protein [Clostridium sp. SM-530-WT-3G]